MSAINIVYQMLEFVVRDCLLIFFQHAPFRVGAEDTQVLFSVNNRRKNRQAKRGETELAPHFFEIKHRRLERL